MTDEFKTDERRRSHSLILVPKNNEEIFRLREALKEEKETKRALNQTSSMNRLVTNRQPRNKAKGLYITEFSSIPVNQKNEKIKKDAVELEGRKNIFNKILLHKQLSV